MPIGSSPRPGRTAHIGCAPVRQPSFVATVTRRCASFRVKPVGIVVQAAMLGSAQMRAKASVSSPVGADSTSPPAVMRKGSMSGEPTAAAVPGRPRADEGPRRSAGPLVSTLGVSGAPW